VTPLEALSRTEKIIAFCRVLLATATLAVVVVDPKLPSSRSDLAYIILTAYVVYSGLLFLLVRGEHLRQERVGPFSAVADIAWVTLISMFTEGGTSPFFLLHVFVISSVSVRWGLSATMLVTVVLALLYPGILFVASHGIGSDVGFRRVHLVRPVYLLVLGYLIGYLGEHERRSKRKLGFMLEMPAAFRRSRAPGRALSRLMRHTLKHFEAERGLLVLRDPESGHYVTWDVVRRDGRTKLAFRVTDTDPLPLPFATATEGFLANDLRPATGTALCYDIMTGTMERRALTLPFQLAEPVAVQAILAAPVLIQRELRGHALVVRGARRKFTRDDLEFLLLLVGQAAAGFENVRLQEKAEEVAVLEERARIARDLHDGFIQSLAGIDLRVEACKMLLKRDPSRVPPALEELHQAVDRGYREVRHYLNALRTSRRPAQDLWTALDRLAHEFSSRERLAVHVARPSADPGLSPSTGYELTQIVREALHNAVRHGRASQVVVKINARPSHLYLIVRDNGQGFTRDREPIDADGFLSPAAAPWSIRERTAALGGALSVWSKAGHGAEIQLKIPAPGKTLQRTPDRRMYA